MNHPLHFILCLQAPSLLSAGMFSLLCPKIHLNPTVYHSLWLPLFHKQWPHHQVQRDFLSPCGPWPWPFPSETSLQAFGDTTLPLFSSAFPQSLSAFSHSHSAFSWWNLFTRACPQPSSFLLSCLLRHSHSPSHLQLTTLGQWFSYLYFEPYLPHLPSLELTSRPTACAHVAPWLLAGLPQPTTLPSRIFPPNPDSPTAFPLPVLFIWPQTLCTWS